jgi:large subunit ribosomal protein L18
MSKIRISVFRSNKHISAQIQDEKGKTLLSLSDQFLKKTEKMTKTQKAKEVGRLLAKKALERKLESVIFERGGFKYHGRVKALAEGAREGGLKF